jgi:hypothetical protein
MRRGIKSYFDQSLYRLMHMPSCPLWPSHPRWYLAFFWSSCIWCRSIYMWHSLVNPRRWAICALSRPIICAEEAASFFSYTIDRRKGAGKKGERKRSILTVSAWCCDASTAVVGMFIVFDSYRQSLEPIRTEWPRSAIVVDLSTIFFFLFSLNGVG